MTYLSLTLEGVSQNVSHYRTLNFFSVMEGLQSFYVFFPILLYANIL